MDELQQHVSGDLFQRWRDDTDATGPGQAFLGVRICQALMNQIDFWAETAYLPYDDRSEVVRQALLQKFQEWEDEHNISPDTMEVGQQ